MTLPSFRLFLALFIGVCGLRCFAEDPVFDSPVGQWTTIDDSDNKPRSVVEIREEKGKLVGQIIKTFPRPGDTGKCVKCEGALKDAPILGFPLIDGLSRDGDVWNGGHIIDPVSGNIYSAKISLQEQGRKLRVRGFLGISLFGRSQVWLRVVPGSP